MLIKILFKQFFSAFVCFFFQQSDEVYLEAQIQNITPGPIFMDHVSLEPSVSYSVTKMNDIDEDDK